MRRFYPSPRSSADWAAYCGRATRYPRDASQDAPREGHTPLRAGVRRAGRRRQEQRRAVDGTRGAVRERRADAHGGGKSGGGLLTGPLRRGTFAADAGPSTSHAPRLPLRASRLVRDLRGGRHLHRPARLVPRSPQVPPLRLGAARTGPDARCRRLLPALAGPADPRDGAHRPRRLGKSCARRPATRARTTIRPCRWASGPPRAGSTRTPSGRPGRTAPSTWW